MRRLALLLAVTTLALATASAVPVAVPVAAADSPRVSYQPPVDGPVVDPFRPPPERWEAGNRGIDYAPGPGTPVRAAADGEVVFAGQVGGELHVVVLHADGIRTSYSFLQSIAVHRGDHVRQGETVGAAGEDVHFGARVGDTYIDPRTLFANGPPKVFLVPDDARRPGTEAEERSGLSRLLGALGSAVRGAAAPGRWVVSSAADAVDTGAQAVTSQVADKLDELRGLANYAGQLNPAVHAARMIRTTVDWWQQRHDCTPADVRPPPLPERRVAVLVGGLGSSSDHDSIDDVNPEGLGYAKNDVVRFSYRGGDIESQPYGARDTTVDLRTSARRLRELLEQVQRQHPGEAVDIIAHSQGGIVARAALAYEYDAKDPRLPRVANLVTLATPHQGTDAATALDMAGHTTTGDLLQWGLDATGVAPFDPRGTSVRQLSETSTFMAKLDDRPLPEGVRLTSIGSRGDFVVPGIHTRVDGGRNAVVSLPGLVSDHSALPGSDAGRREVALAVAGLPPTCQSFTDMLADTAVSDAITVGEDAVGAALYGAGRWADGGLESLATDPKRREP